MIQESMIGVLVCKPASRLLDDCLLPFTVEVLAVELTDESLVALFLLSTLLDFCETLSAFMALVFCFLIAISLLALRSSFGRKPWASAIPAAYRSS